MPDAHAHLARLLQGHWFAALPQSSLLVSRVCPE